MIHTFMAKMKGMTDLYNFECIKESLLNLVQTHCDDLKEVIRGTHDLNSKSNVTLLAHRLCDFKPE